MKKVVLAELPVSLCNGLPSPWHRRCVKPRVLPVVVEAANNVGASELRALGIEHQELRQLVVIVGIHLAPGARRSFEGVLGGRGSFEGVLGARGSFGGVLGAHRSIKGVLGARRSFGGVLGAHG